MSMVAVFVAAARRMPRLAAQPVLLGALYGLLLWALMYVVVLPLRWPALFPHFTAISFAEQMFSHIALVGIPLAWMTRESLSAKYSLVRRAVRNPQRHP